MVAVIVAFTITVSGLNQFNTPGILNPYNIKIVSQLVIAWYKF